MTRHILWKEAREQGSVLLALVGLGGGLLAATAILNGPAGAAEGLTFRTVNSTGRILLVMLVLAAGTVAGGSLFAGEREAGTFTFLDHLPGSRWRVWWRKVLAGGVLAAGASLLLLVAAGLAGQLGGTSQPVLVGWLLAVGLLTAVGFGWGAFGSARAGSSLAACGVGLAGSLVTVLVVVPGLTVLWALVGQWVGPYLGVRREPDGGLVGLVGLWAILCVPLPLAALVYTAPDRDRRLAEQDIRPARREFAAGDYLPRRPRLRGPGGGRLRWLVWRQWRGPLAVHAGLALLAGLLVVPWADFWVPSLIWPVVGLGLGVLAGVTGVADDQRNGAVRFWAERRLPVGRLWLTKVLAGLLLTGGLCVLALVPPLLAAVTGGRRANGVLEALFESGLFERGFPHLTYLVLGPVYGFAFGHLAGLLFPKGVVAGAVGLMLGGTFAAAWGPSLLAGGLHGWVAFLPAGVALVVARSVVWAWATDQVARRRSLLRLAAGAVLAVGCVAAGLLHRAFGDVPLVSDPGEHLRFRADLPTFDEKQAGRDLRRAVSKWQELSPRVREAAQVYAPGGDRTSGLSPNRRRQVADVLAAGWPADRPDLGRWADEAFAGEWDAAVFEAASKPVGVLEDPNEFYSPEQLLRHLPILADIGPVFLLRGLQQQARGDPADFVARLDAWLAAVRTAKHHTFPVAVLVATGAEAPAYQALDRWLERLADRPDLVQKALDVVQRHDRLDQPDPAGERLAEQVLFQNGVDAPAQWLPKVLDRLARADARDPGLGRASVRAESEGNVTAFAWAVPWERERLRRAVALGNVPGLESQRRDHLAGAPGLWLYELDWSRAAVRPSGGVGRVAAARRAAVVGLALRLHRLGAGGYPDTLDELVPGRLPAVPADPFLPGSQPLRYRVLARAETLTLPADLAPGGRPTLPPGAALTFDDYLTLAGLAGGLTGWPLEPGWPDDSPHLAGPADPPAANGTMTLSLPGVTARWALPLADEWRPRPDPDPRPAEVRLAAGRAVVWSVGPDGRHGGAGDLVFVVPDPPASPAAGPPPR